MLRARRVAAALALAALASAALAATPQTPLLHPDFAFSCKDANATRCEAAAAGCVRAAVAARGGGGGSSARVLARMLLPFASARRASHSVPCADARILCCPACCAATAHSPGGCDPPDAAAKHALLVDCGLSCRAQLPRCPPVSDAEAAQLHAEQKLREGAPTQRCDDAHANCAFLVAECAPARAWACA
jgi:hypothetical protein